MSFTTFAQPLATDQMILKATYRDEDRSRTSGATARTSFYRKFLGRRPVEASVGPRPVCAATSCQVN